MKNALLIGCGNKRGSRVIEGCEEAGYHVTNIGSTVSSKTSVKNIQIDWNELDIIELHKILQKIDSKIDFIFFNQNSSTMSHTDFSNKKQTLELWTTVKSWTKSYWLSCQLPYFLIQTLDKKLDKQSIIGWMLSSYIDHERKNVESHPDYSGYKFTNYLIMKNFSKKFHAFGINPEFEKTGKIKNLIKEICIGNKKCNGSMF